MSLIGKGLWTQPQRCQAGGFWFARLEFVVLVIFIWTLSDDAFMFVAADELSSSSMDEKLLVAAAKPCNTSQQCQSEVSPLSVCLSSLGECSIPHSNPLERGCFYGKQLPGWQNKNRIRVCNSDDLPEAREMGLCRTTGLDYLEIRIKCQDWESVTFGSWILQFILSELLDIPTTLETGTADAVMQFYDTADRFEFGTTSNNLQAFRNAVNAGGDCRKLHKLGPPSPPSPLEEEKDETTYLNCAHVIPEVWTARSAQVREYIEQNILEPPLSLGALGIEGWYIPKYTAEADPTLTSWIGMRGPHNRQKLAQMFKRPTTWLDYCQEHSPTNCSVTDYDGVAKRPPQNVLEEQSLFHQDAFTGYFRYTPLNNCTEFPHNCTGHIGDWGCGWGGSLEAQVYHLDIGLQSNGGEPNSGGWTYTQLSQLWHAANTTRNHVVMMWTAPDPTYEEFVGTDFEFVKVTLPAPTQECIKHRINPEVRCDPDPVKRRGTAKGVCDGNARPLYKLVLKNLVEYSTKNAKMNNAVALRNPAYDVLAHFSLSELQINEMFQYWQTVNSTSSTPREAICQWAVDNFDSLKAYIPRTYPRAIQQGDSSSSSKAVGIASTLLGCMATLLVMGTTAMVYRHRKRRVFRYAQIEFLFLLLAGSACVSIGAILTGLQEPTNGTCITAVWLLALGYTLELVPLLVKVAAINGLTQAAQRLRRVTLRRSSLHGGVAAIGLAVAIFLILWTVLDPPQRQVSYQLTSKGLDLGSQNSNGGNNDERYNIMTTLVQVEYYCSSESYFWEYTAVGWNLVLLLCASVLAFQSRNTKQDFNESRVLSRLVYAHFLFVVLRAMTLLFFNDRSVADPTLSIIFSLDTIVMVFVYFVPKFLADDRFGVLERTSTHVYNSVYHSAQYASRDGPSTVVSVGGGFDPRSTSFAPTRNEQNSPKPTAAAIAAAVVASLQHDLSDYGCDDLANDQPTKNDEVEGKGHNFLEKDEPTVDVSAFFDEEKSCARAGPEESDSNLSTNIQSTKENQPPSDDQKRKDLPPVSLAEKGEGPVENSRATDQGQTPSTPTEVAPANHDPPSIISMVEPRRLEGRVLPRSQSQQRVDFLVATNRTENAKDASNPMKVNGDSVKA